MFHVTESFPFGCVKMACASSPSLGSALEVQRVGLLPALPDGMAVDLVTAYRISFASSTPIQSFSFDFTLAECQTKGDVNSGEWLEAQSWPIGNGLLMFGTEDGESLQSRMPWLRIEGADYPVEYMINGFRVSIPHVKPNTTVGFHFVLAYNHVDKRCDSEWFAVDVPHVKICEFPVLKHFSGANAG